MQSTGTRDSLAISIQCFLCSALKLHLSMMGILFLERIDRVRSSQALRLPMLSWLTRSYFHGASCIQISQCVRDQMTNKKKGALTSTNREANVDFPEPGIPTKISTNFCTDPAFLLGDATRCAFFFGGE